MAEILSLIGLSENENNKIKSMSCGMFNNKSYWGYKSSVLKSGVCKYFRRELYDKFEWCVMEMMIFGLKNVGLMSNIINRMKVLIVEELMLSEMEVINKCAYLFNMIDNVNSFVSKVEIIKMICEIVKKCKKCRMVSYVNNWWKYNEVDYEYEYIQLDKVLKYKKKNDSDELLILGELLIKFIEEKDENVINIFNKMLKLDGGLRYRRKNGVYLYFEILEDIFLKNNKKLFGFIFERFSNINLKERNMFGVWIGLLCIKNENVNIGVDFSYKLSMNENEVVEYLFKRRDKIEINEDFVVNDYHVNKKFGLGKFGRVGSYVVNEDLSLLGDNGLKYKEFYILKKDDLDKENEEKKIEKKNIEKKNIEKKNIEKKNIEKKNIEKNKSLKKLIEELIENIKNKNKIVLLEDDNNVIKEKKKRVVKNKVENIEEIKNYEFIDFKEFEVVKVIVEGVCGLKKCCIIVKKDDELYILKEILKSFNYGRDYLFMDSVKKEFGILDLNMKLIKSNCKLKFIDKSIKSWKNNFEFEECNEVAYCMMKYYENIGDLGINKKVLENENIIYSLLKIRLFDGLFRSSDNSIRNILVLLDGRLLSIDENDIFGKRLNIFNKNDWCKKSDWCKNNYIKVIDDLYGENKEEKKDKIIKYLIDNGFGEKVEEFSNRWDNYKQIVGEEIIG